MSLSDACFLQLKNSLVKHLRLYCVKFVAHEHGVACCSVGWVGHSPSKIL